MDALHARRINEDLERWTRLRQIGDPPGQQLQCDRLAARNVEVRTHHSLNHRKKGPHDSIMIKTGDVVERLFDLVGQLVGRYPARLAIEPELRIETRLEQLDEVSGDVDVAAQGLGEIALAVRYADLAKVAADRAKHADVTPIKIGSHDQPIEAIGLVVADVGGRKRGHETLP